MKKTIKITCGTLMLVFFMGTSGAQLDNSGETSKRTLLDDLRTETNDEEKAFEEPLNEFVELTRIEKYDDAFSLYETLSLDQKKILGNTFAFEEDFIFNNADSIKNKINELNGMFDKSREKLMKQEESVRVIEKKIAEY